MSYPLNYPTPTNADVQIFVGGGTSVTANARTKTWIKPQGASFVWFTLIGAGGNGNGAYGGGSGAVTNCLVPAFLIPDSLLVSVGNEGSQLSTRIYWQGSKAANGYTLLTANTGSTFNPGASSAATAFAAAGFYQSVTGQDGSNGSRSASATTFLSGGASSAVTSNYGYIVPNGSGSGSFRLKPISGNGANGTGTGGIGCGGGAVSGKGGAGMAVIISW